VAHNDDLSVKAPLVRVGGAGDIDIGNSRLDYVAKASVVSTSKGQGGADLDHLAGLTVPVKLTGTFDAPKYEIDYRALASSAAKAKIETEGREKLKERLRGLLKR
jgi:AsmA protein